MNKLSNFSQGRDNNFNLIRIIAALAVLFSHSFAVVTGSGDSEPFRGNIGMTPGTIAVDVFFITSGFLVTASLLNRQSIIEFAWARALRIFPALIVMLLLTVLALGPFFTSLPLSEYFSNRGTYTYLPRCSTFFMSISYVLPGVFDTNPTKAVNGSLWSMPFEVRMYTILAVAWFALKLTRTYRLKALKIMIIAYAALSGAYTFADHFYFLSNNYFTKLSFMFFMGSAFYVLKERIHLLYWIFWGIMIAIALSVRNKDVFYIVYNLSIAYILFFLAYIPSGQIRKYNLIGDYSYGVYIYAWPVQQSVAALIPDVSVLNMIIISGTVTILLSVISWHLIEKHALGMKGRYVNHTKRLINIGLMRVMPSSFH